MRNSVPPILERLALLGRQAEGLARPARCRAILFNASGTDLLLVGRKRPGQVAYAVYPGGGIKEEDVTPTDGILRELREELDLGSEDVVLSGQVLEHEGDLFYLGYVSKDISDFSIGGPEARRDPGVFGTYAPGWFPVANLAGENIVPREITATIGAEYARL